MGQPATAQQPFLKGSILWERKGPLPVWAWAGLVLLVVLAVTMWRRNRSGAEAAEANTGYVDELPGQQHYPAPIFVVPQAATPAVNVGPFPITLPDITVPTAPPGGGSPPPAAPPAPAPVPSPPGTYVTVARYSTSNPPWNSTLWGIWNKYKTTANWQAIWNHPLNADIRNKRGAADRIQPGDKVFVPGAS